MVEAVQTTQSTLGIWVIVAVAMISLAIWLVGIYVADSYQTRLSRLWRRANRPGPALDDAGASAAAIPSQRRDADQQPAEPAPAPEAVAAARGRHARPWEHQQPEREPASRPTDYLRTDFRQDGPLTQVETELAGSGPTRADVPAQAQAEAPTRADLPAQPTPDQAPTGRHAMPAQRSGDADRAERSYAGPDADREDDDNQR